jgi:hypothetical protein
LEDGKICSIGYDVFHDEKWVFTSAKLSGWAGQTKLQAEIHRNQQGKWLENGKTKPNLDGFLDIDLGFTPATNTSAIRRLHLDDGQSEHIVAAWLDTKDWTLKPLEQEYAKLSQTKFKYRSVVSGYSTILRVDHNGLVTDYPEIWGASFEKT